jgi:hypothetical protein
MCSVDKSAMQTTNERRNKNDGIFRVPSFACSGANSLVMRLRNEKTTPENCALLRRVITRSAVIHSRSSGLPR